MQVNPTQGGKPPVRQLRRIEDTKVPTEQHWFSKWMGTAFSRGDGEHLPAMRSSDAAFFITETQADVFPHELSVEEVDDDERVWADGAEKGFVNVPVPRSGRMISIRITGEAQLWVGHNGKIMLDPRSCQ